MNARLNINADYFPLLAGQELHAIKRGQSAAAIVEEIMNEAKVNLSELNKKIDL